MKVYIIKASTKHSLFKEYKGFMAAPPQSIYSAAAVTPKDVDLKITDETSEGSANLREKADLVAIFMSTPDAYRGYELGDHFRKQGIPVVFGGLHASFVSEEVLEHADAVMKGEEDLLWPSVLRDLRAGQLQKIYKNAEPPSMVNMERYPHEAINMQAYDGMGSVMVSRGCRFKCTYCTVHKFFPTFRRRPVGEVIDEIRASGLEYLELHADNLIADRDYAMELFQALKPLNVKWMAEATLNLAQYDDILEAAAEAGLFYLLVGIETPSQAALKACGKNFIKVDKAKENVRKLHEYQIAVDSAMLFGFDEHTPDIFKETLDFVDEIELDSCAAAIVTPFPGTALFEQMEREGRLLTRDWSKYDCSNAVFEPKNMTARELEEGADWYHRKYNGWIRAAKRKSARIRNIGPENAMYF
ncbi:B12-binding domain-containing radical SAM protein [Sansalvadorimonas sp. 2012CJ34-2]|uniref:B12-binding domain-containing radical SAM protein n=1 Tax=Parendozoicomonas callyspongiae TaxID=2942213 RepID=A0ABT0PB49_9GAMM|nr:radical SAM protein [Sansalvadorimonas sp. 2012CJ34-2]MCL6268614.1 B12-binding domain-containing radical SAM protein [Sansalvadorimonas sp. 2012CJ34-2]